MEASAAPCRSPEGIVKSSRVVWAGEFEMKLQEG